MDDEVEAAPGLAEAREGALELVLVGDVALEEAGAWPVAGELLEILLEALPLIAEGELRARRMQPLGDRPPEAPRVRDPHHQPTLALQVDFDHGGVSYPIGRWGRGRV